MRIAVKAPDSVDYRRKLGMMFTETRSSEAPKHLATPFFPPSDPAKWLV